jgi:hypothetical protein
MENLEGYERERKEGDYIEMKAYWKVFKVILNFICVIGFFSGAFFMIRYFEQMKIGNLILGILIFIAIGLILNFILDTENEAPK